MSRDFRTDRIRTTQIIADSAGPVQKANIIIYPSQSATDYVSGFSPGLVTNIGTDAFLFVSGSVFSKKTSNSFGISLFGGDVVSSGSITAEKGLSGSLTRLMDGTSYLVAGTNVTISSSSNGQVVISSTGGGAGSGNWNELSPTPRLNTTASVAIAGGLGSSFAAQNIGIDAFFFVSGTIASRGSANAGSAVFGGDTITSGSFFALNGVGEISSDSKNVILSLKSNNNSSELIQSTAGNFALRNQTSGGDLIISAKTSGGVANNFIDFRPKGALTGSILSIFPVSTYPGATSPFNAADTNFFVAGGRNKKDGITGGTSVFGGDLVTSGSMFLGTDASDKVVFNSTIASDIIPDGNRTRNLGSETTRFANIYTGDLHLKNDRGDYTLIEEEDCLTIRFNKTGKRYKFVLEPAPEFDDK